MPISFCSRRTCRTVSRSMAWSSASTISPRSRRAIPLRRACSSEVSPIRGSVPTTVVRTIRRSSCDPDGHPCCGWDKSLAIPIGILNESTETSLLNLFFEELDFALKVDVVEAFQVFVADLLHVETVDGTDVDALLATDALRVVKLRDHNRFSLSVIRTVQHVDATGRTFPFAFLAADAHIRLENRMLSDPIDQDDLLVRVLFRHAELVCAVVEVLPGVVRELELLREVPGVRGTVLHAVPTKEAMPDVHRGPPDHLLHLVQLRAAGVQELRRGFDLVELEVDAFVRADLRAQLAADALEPVDAVLAPIRERELDLLVRIQMGDRLPASGDEAVDAWHGHQGLLDRRDERANRPADRPDLAAPGLSFGLGGLHTCTRPSACPSTGLPAR